MEHERSPEGRYAQLLTVRNPGWQVTYDTAAGVYRAWRLDNGRPLPPALSDVNPAPLEARIRSGGDTAGPAGDPLTARLRDAIYAMRDRGLLPCWQPDSAIVHHG